MIGHTDLSRLASRTRIWFPVRCCCKPTTLLGFLPLERVVPRQTIKDRDGTSHTIELQVVGRCTVPAHGYFNRGTVDFSAVSISDLKKEDELAIYSDDRSLEFWRTIPGFVEAANQEDT